jgi:hypothetical protein
LAAEEHLAIRLDHHRVDHAVDIGREAVRRGLGRGARAPESDEAGEEGATKEAAEDRPEGRG